MPGPRFIAAAFTENAVRCLQIPGTTSAIGGVAFRQRRAPRPLGDSHRPKQLGRTERDTPASEKRACGLSGSAPAEGRKFRDALQQA